MRAPFLTAAVSLLFLTLNAAQAQEQIEDQAKEKPQEPRAGAPSESAGQDPIRLPTLTVTASPASAQPVYQQETSTAATKFPAEITSIPQSIQVITRDAFEDQGAQSLGDIMMQVPSAQKTSSRFNNFPGTKIRGFPVGDIRNGIRQLFFGDVDRSALFHVQSVQVLKGPGGVLFGEGNAGGVINVVSKRPYEGYGAKVSLGGTYWPGFSGTMTSLQWDFNAPLTEDGAIQARLNGVIARGHTFIDSQELDRTGIGLVLTYDDGGPVRGFVNLLYHSRDVLVQPGLPVSGTVKSSGVGQISRDTYLGEPKFTDLDAQGILLQTWAEVDLIDNWNGILKNWKIIPRYQYQTFDSDLEDIDITGTTVTNGKILVSRDGRTNFNELNVVHIFQLDLTGTLETGPLSHQLFMSGDYSYDYLPHTGDHNFWFNIPDYGDINALNPTYRDTPPQVDPDIVTFGHKRTKWSVIFQDLVAVTPYLDLLAGIRHSNVYLENTGNLASYDSREHDATTFQVGAAVHVTDSIHLFSGYAEGFNFVGGTTADGELFEPEQYSQVEVGVKANFPWGLSGTVALFDITRANVKTPDLNNPGFSVQTGGGSSSGCGVRTRLSSYSTMVLPGWLYLYRLGDHANQPGWTEG